MGIISPTKFTNITQKAGFTRPILWLWVWINSTPYWPYFPQNIGAEVSRGRHFGGLALARRVQYPLHMNAIYGAPQKETAAPATITVSLPTAVAVTLLICACWWAAAILAVVAYLSSY